MRAGKRRGATSTAAHGRSVEGMEDIEGRHVRGDDGAQFAAVAWRGSHAAARRRKGLPRARCASQCSSRRALLIWPSAPIREIAFPTRRKGAPVFFAAGETVLLFRMFFIFTRAA